MSAVEAHETPAVAALRHLGWSTRMAFGGKYRGKCPGHKVSVEAELYETGDGFVFECPGGEHDTDWLIDQFRLPTPPIVVQRSAPSPARPSPAAPPLAAEPLPVPPGEEEAPPPDEALLSIPAGFVAWSGSDHPRDERPQMRDGPAFDTWPGGLVDSLAPYTEADPAGLLMTLLTYAGAAMTGRPHIYLGNVNHPARLNTGLIGATSKARKGTADAVISPLIEKADSEFFRTRLTGGFGSGEAVIDAVRDADDNGDAGSRDKRLLVREPEFSRLLKVANRQGSTLSEIVREAWDGGVLQVRSRSATSVATGAHVCMIAHVTVEGLRRHLNDEDVANGFANRMLYIAVGRAQVLPHGAEVPAPIATDAGKELGELIRRACNRGRVGWADDAARDAWEAFYRRCAAEDSRGIVGALTARAEPHVARLALLFCLLDPDATLIEVGHLAAAEAVWEHSAATVRWVFGDRDGDPDADRLLLAIRAHGAHGMTATEQSQLFAKHKTKDDLERLRQRLERRGLIVTGTVPSGGRPAVVSVAVERTS
jgi:hypothetical protein